MILLSKNLKFFVMPESRKVSGFFTSDVTEKNSCILQGFQDSADWIMDSNIHILVIWTESELT